MSREGGAETKRDKESETKRVCVNEKSEPYFASITEA